MRYNNASKSAIQQREFPVNIYDGVDWSDYKDVQLRVIEKDGLGWYTFTHGACQTEQGRFDFMMSEIINGKHYRLFVEHRTYLDLSAEAEVYLFCKEDKTLEHKTMPLRRARKDYDVRSYLPQGVITYE